MSRLTVVRQGAPAPEAAPGDTVIGSDDLRAWLRSGAVLGRLGRYSEARLRTERLGTLGRPLAIAAVLRCLSRGRCDAEDATGATTPIGIGALARWTAAVVRESFSRRRFIAEIDRAVTALEAATADGPHPCVVDPRGLPVYVRADVSFELKAGGSVSHTAGVVNHLGDVAPPPVVLTTARIPTLAPGIEAHDIDPDERFWHYRELPAFALNAAVTRAVRRAVSGRAAGFLYQRYALSGFASVALARELRVPLVTEYNGSEVWVARHWGQPLRHESLAARIERLNLRASHLVTVVSQPLADEVAGLGVDPRRILVNPNGVDPSRYRPDLDGSAVRARYGLGGATVVGFIGTFGPWHGAEVLADAFVRLLSDHPEHRDRVKVLWIGDGATLPQVRRVIAAAGLDASCAFTGLVPQEEGAAHLAACDILASPHVPNPDGTPFFGSPTKLFEYMAMGRPIVASDLDQVGEILEHGRAGRMVVPGHADSLAEGLHAVLSDPVEGRRLATEARKLAEVRYSWRAHVARIHEALTAVMHT